jgi:hypothetical protein
MRVLHTVAGKNVLLVWLIYRLIGTGLHDKERENQTRWRSASGEGVIIISPRSVRSWGGWWCPLPALAIAQTLPVLFMVLVGIDRSRGYATYGCYPKDKHEGGES